MEKRFVPYWLGALAIFLFCFGILPLLLGFSSNSYYNKPDYYNHLPAWEDTPAPIQHYEQAVEKSVQQTEQSNTEVQNITSITQLIPITNQDGSTNYIGCTFLFIGLLFFLRATGIMRWRFL